jgi:hypothetical protein
VTVPVAEDDATVAVRVTLVLVVGVVVDAVSVVVVAVVVVVLDELLAVELQPVINIEPRANNRTAIP